MIQVYEHFKLFIPHPASYINI